MIRFACPTCAAVFTVGDEKGGKPGKCPKCFAQFMVPEAPAASAPADAVEIAPCPKCQARLSISRGDLGSSVECPYCKNVYAAKLPGAASRRSSAAVELPPPPPPPPRPSRREEEEDDEDDYEPRPSRRKKRAGRSFGGGRTVTVTRIGVLASARIMFAIYGAFGLIAAVIVLILMLLGAALGGGGNNGPGAGVMVGMGFCYVILLPLFYGAAGFVGGAMMALMYNLCAGFIGGFEMDLE